jgi:hypothetical protein
MDMVRKSFMAEFGTKYIRASGLISADLKKSRFLVRRLDTDLSAVGRKQIREPLGPLEQHNAASVEEVPKSEGLNLSFFLEPIEIHMINAFGVLVDQSEGRAANRLRGRGAEAFYDPLRQGRLARSKVSDEQNNAFQLRRKPAAERNSLVPRPGPESA